jgi:hypothetical protein
VSIEEGFEIKLCFFFFWLQSYIAHPIYLLEIKIKNKTQHLKGKKNITSFIILGTKPSSLVGPKMDQLVGILE